MNCRKLARADRQHVRPLFSAAVAAAAGSACAFLACARPLLCGDPSALFTLYTSTPDIDLVPPTCADLTHTHTGTSLNIKERERLGTVDGSGQHLPADPVTRCRRPPTLLLSRAPLPSHDTPRGVEQGRVPRAHSAGAWWRRRAPHQAGVPRRSVRQCSPLRHGGWRR